jgi:hypothetical protein
MVELGHDNGGMVLDLGEGGLAIQAISPIAHQQTLPVHFELPNSSYRINATAEICWASGSKHAGLRFTDISDQAREEIKRWVGTLSPPQRSASDSADDWSKIYRELPLIAPPAWLKDATAATIEFFAATVRYIPEQIRRIFREKNQRTVPVPDPTNRRHPIFETVVYVPKFAKQQIFAKIVSTANQAAADKGQRRNKPAVTHKSAAAPSPGFRSSKPQPPPDETQQRVHITVHDLKN